MRNVDMSAKAVTARLKLVSELRRLCLALGTVKAKTHIDDGKEKKRIQIDDKLQNGRR